ncbi:MAG: tRNA (guanosine(46)-N7)-methyltransferase TrmB [Gammaproteobacteria bacterium]|nr:tRNA (guanosine(46)-N7)-methyltransferase TrmB [Gammaproteobacteria bacterium]
MEFESKLRQVRSFVLRTSRLTQAQAKALDELWPTMGWDADAPLNINTLFGRDAPLWIEIGIGNGDALLHAAKLNPSKNLIGIEVHTPGVGHCLLGAQREQIDNIRLAKTDAMDILRQCVPDNSVEQLNLYFPDPWHKKRHHKRRIVNDEFVSLVHQKLIAGGKLHMATDWQDYADWMQETLARHADKFTLSDHPIDQRPDWRPETRFERRGQRLGHSISDLIYCKP